MRTTLAEYAPVGVFRPRWLAWSTVVFATVAFYMGLRLSQHMSGWLTMGAATTATFAMVLVWHRERILDWFPLNSRDLAIGAIAGALMAAVTHVGHALLTGMDAAMAREVSVLYLRLTAPPGPLRALPLLLLAILTEELVWRGLLIADLERIERPDWIESPEPGVYHGPWAVCVAVLAAGAYAIPHLGSGSLLLLGAAFACGLVWTSLRLWTGALTAPLIAHVLWDLAVLVVWPLA